jgi:hypothetical protein
MKSAAEDSLTGRPSQTEVVPSWRQPSPKRRDGFAIRSQWMTIPLGQVHDGVNALTFATTGCNV